MANSTASVAVAAFPDGYDNTLSHQWYLGTITVAAGTYPANGIPLTFNTADFLTSNTPTFGEILSASSGYTYRFDPTNQTLRVFPQGLTASGAAATTAVTAATSATAATITVTGAAVGDTVKATPSAAITAGLSYYAYVSAANTVVVEYVNATAGSITPAAVTFYVDVTPAGNVPELQTGATVPAGVTGDSIKFHLMFRRN